MSFCASCQKQDDVRFRKIYATCEIADGGSCVPCKEYLEIEAEIEKTQKVLEEQLGRRREIRENINRIHDPMLSRVPAEITAHVFELAVSVDVDRPGGGTTPLREGEIYAPLPLGRVCGAWRHIAWSMPHLWNFMPVKIQTPEQMPSRLDVAERWLSRAGDYLPLSIDCRINESYEEEEDDESCDEFVDFIDLLKEYSRRWKNLCFVSPSPLLRHLFYKLKGTPLLQNIQLTSVDYAEAEEIFPCGRKFRPHPRSLSLHHIFFIPDVGIDWGHLTQLKLDTVGASILLDSLTRLRSLKDLRLYDMFDNFVHSKPVTHPTLETFHVECPNDSSEELCNLLNHLIFPSLYHIKINLQHRSDLVNAVTSFIRRSSCKLISLSISHFPRTISFDSSMDLLKHLAFLEELEVAAAISEMDDGDFLGILFSCFQIHQEDPQYLIYQKDAQCSTAPLPFPTLRRFTYVAQDAHEIPWDLLLALFDRRWCIQRPQWKTLSVLCQSTSASDLGSGHFLHRGSDKEIIDGFLEIVEAGVDLFLPRRMGKDDLLELKKPEANRIYAHVEGAVRVRTDGN